MGYSAECGYGTRNANDHSAAYPLKRGSIPLPVEFRGNPRNNLCTCKKHGPFKVRIHITQKKARKRHYWSGKMFAHVHKCSTHTEHARACACGSFGHRFYSYASGIGGTCRPRNYFHGYPHAHGMAEIRGIPRNITRGTVIPWKSIL